MLRSLSPCNERVQVSPSDRRAASPCQTWLIHATSQARLLLVQDQALQLHHVSQNILVFVTQLLVPVF